MRRFNSMMVRLQRNYMISSLILKICFNSMMVRLQLIRRCLLRKPLLRFNSMMVRLQRDNPSVALTTESVSIPWWYDYNVSSRQKKRHLAGVSIPWWYDYNKSLSCKKSASSGCFNSMMVRLQLKMNVVSLIVLIPFQFHDGTITTRPQEINTAG